MLYVSLIHSSFAIILMGKRSPVALLCLSSWCLMIVVWLFLTMRWVCLQFVIVIFPDQTHYYLRHDVHVRMNAMGSVLVSDVPD